MNTEIFWKSDFVGPNYDQLIDILKQEAVKGEGYWFMVKTNFVVACIRNDQYYWIMEHVANYGDPNINK